MVCAGLLFGTADPLPLNDTAIDRAMNRKFSLSRALDTYRQELVARQPGAIKVFALVWLGFIVMEVVKNLFFLPVPLTPSLMLLLLSRALYEFLPWFGFSLLIAVLLREGQAQCTDRRESLLFHGVAAATIGLIHILILTSAYWLFSPGSVTRVTFEFVLIEQFLKWMHFELLGYAAVLMYWRRILAQSSTNDSPSTDADSANEASGAGAEPRGPMPSILLNYDEGTSRVPIGDIHWLAADDNYVIVNGAFGSIRVRTTLKALLSRLPTDRFHQTHRSAAVNLGEIANVDSLRVTLHTGTRLPISRRRHKPLLESLQEFGITC